MQSHDCESEPLGASETASSRRPDGARDHKQHWKRRFEEEGRQVANAGADSPEARLGALHPPGVGKQVAIVEELPREPGHEQEHDGKRECHHPPRSLQAGRCKGEEDDGHGNEEARVEPRQTRQPQGNPAHGQMGPRTLRMAE